MVLQQGEQYLGRYKVRFARFGRGGWQSFGPWMRAMVTDRRLIVLPDEAQAEREPMVIASRSIDRVWQACLGKRDGGIIQLHSGELLYFYVEWSEAARLVKDLKLMVGVRVTPSARLTGNSKHIIN